MVRWVLTILGILAVVGLLVAIKGAQIGMLIGFGKKAMAEGPPPEAVSTAIADEQEWEGTLSAVGSVATAKGVALSADVPGTVTRVHFDSGDTVKQGQILVELDTSVERAQLASAVTRKDLATTTYGRTKALADKGAISPSQLDADESALRSATNEIETIQAQIAKKTIRAPFTGKLGIRAVNLGQYLQPGTPITVLETPDAVKVDFTLPQQQLGEVKIGMPLRIEVEGSGEPPMTGAVAAVDPTVDPVTRAIKLRADVPKAKDLRPGMFVKVTVLLPEKKRSTIVPATAILHAPYGDSVFVVEDRKADAPGPAKTPDGRPIKVARQQFVKVGASRGDFVAIVEGVKAKQEVVSAGVFKLRNGGSITIDNSHQPTPKLDPHPANR